MKQGPKILVAPEKNVAAATAIATVGSSKRGHLIPQKMFTAGASVPAPAKYPDLVDEIIFLHRFSLSPKISDSDRQVERSLLWLHVVDCTGRDLAEFFRHIQSGTTVPNADKIFQIIWI